MIDLSDYERTDQKFLTQFYFGKFRRHFLLPDGETMINDPPGILYSKFSLRQMKLRGGRAYFRYLLNMPCYKCFNERFIYEVYRVSLWAKHKKISSAQTLGDLALTLSYLERPTAGTTKLHRWITPQVAVIAHFLTYYAIECAVRKISFNYFDVAIDYALRSLNSSVSKLFERMTANNIQVSTRCTLRHTLTTALLMQIMLEMDQAGISSATYPFCFIREFKKANDVKDLLRSDPEYCSICINVKLDENVNFGCLSDCIHIFCYQCLMKWRAVSECCPLCRASGRLVFSRDQFLACKAFYDQFFATVVAAAAARLRGRSSDSASGSGGDGFFVE
ncbi:uncharacterized protein LOC108669308 [Hyalella azteca]|uniref:Uncharacterized protein LOC108669308 n=1 Tax=Hyalella azteca TaxID=294128 RepID=A0A8B7NEP9_HYAAZ|nr:uncharacterized protein LOC108669308 [Hyalella azteca]